VQFKNDQLYIHVTLLEIIIDVSDVQPANTLLPILVTLLGIVMDVSAVPENASLPICVTLSGIIIDVSVLRFENAEQAIPVVPSVNVIEVFAGIEPFHVYATLPT
jgi:hypothetical protein